MDLADRIVQAAAALFRRPSDARLWGDREAGDQKGETVAWLEVAREMTHLACANGSQDDATIEHLSNVSVHESEE